MAKAYKCDNCLDFYEGTPAYKEGRIELCSKCVRVIRAFQGSKPFSESDENPYDKYSYNSGLCYEDGSPCWGLDIKYCLYELKHGRNPYEFRIK